MEVIGDRASSLPGEDHIAAFVEPIEIFYPLSRIEAEFRAVDAILTLFGCERLRLSEREQPE